MQNIIEYIKNSIKSDDKNEFVILDSFDLEVYNNMKQDGIIIINKIEDKLDYKIDNVTIGNYTVIRKNFPKQIEWLNEDKTYSFDLTNTPIYRRLIPPPIETVNHIMIISNIIKETNGTNKNYIEYGVRDGTCIEQIAPFVNKAYGIDIEKYNTYTKNIFMYKMTTDDFSNKFLEDIEYDYAFIDANHSSQQVLIDFEHLYKYIKNNGYIFLHDTYPCKEEFLLPHYCNDCYLSPILIKERYPYIQILTLPLNPGITIIKKSELRTNKD